jgi:hypothetical protein
MSFVNVPKKKIEKKNDQNWNFSRRRRRRRVPGT